MSLLKSFMARVLAVVLALSLLSACGLSAEQKKLNEDYVGAVASLSSGLNDAVKRVDSANDEIDLLRKDEGFAATHTELFAKADDARKQFDGTVSEAVEVGSPVLVSADTTDGLKSFKVDDEVKQDELEATEDMVSQVNGASNQVSGTANDFEGVVDGLKTAHVKYQDDLKALNKAKSDLSKDVVEANKLLSTYSKNALFKGDAKLKALKAEVDKAKAVADAKPAVLTEDTAKVTATAASLKKLSGEVKAYADKKIADDKAAQAVAAKKKAEAEKRAAAERARKAAEAKKKAAAKKSYNNSSKKASSSKKYTSSKKSNKSTSAKKTSSKKRSSSKKAAPKKSSNNKGPIGLTRPGSKAPKCDPSLHGKFLGYRFGDKNKPIYAHCPSN